MFDTNFTAQKNFPIESNGFGPPIVSFTDYARLRQCNLSDELAEELDRAIVVHTAQIPEDVVTMHARCTYIDERIGTQREVELVYPDEADLASGKISILTPVGSALIGLRVGQKIAWDFPDGTVRSLKVASVSRGVR